MKISPPPTLFEWATDVLWDLKVTKLTGGIMVHWHNCSVYVANRVIDDYMSLNERLGFALMIDRRLIKTAGGSDGSG